MVQFIRAFFWRFGKKLSLRVWSNLIFIFAFLFPALVLLAFSLVTTIQNYRNTSLLDSSHTIQQIEESFQSYLKDLEQTASTFLEDKNLKLLFSSLNNVDRYEDENPIIRKWLTDELLLLKVANNLDGMAIISLNKDILAHTQGIGHFPESILKTPVVDTPQFRNSLSGLQLIPGEDLKGNLKNLSKINSISDKIPVIAIKIPIIEENTISGTLLTYKILQKESNWVRENADKYKSAIGVYIDQILSFTHFPKIIDSFRDNIIKYLEIWRPIQEMNNNFDLEKIRKRPEQQFFYLKDFEKKKIGAISIIISTNRYSDQIVTSIILYTVLFLTWIFLGIIFRIWTLRIINRIHRVSESIREISAGNYSRRLVTDGHLEVSELSQEINKMALEIHKREKLKDDFLANTSHELRTPLLGIIGLAESMIDGATGQLSNEAKSQLSVISSSGNRLSKLINDILDIAKLKNSDLILKKNPIDLYSMLEVVFKLLQPLVGKKDLVLMNQISEETPLVNGDEERIFQIFFNLIGNAIKFTENGSVRVKTEYSNDKVTVFIEDTGIGIPDDAQSFIFESFQQSPNEKAIQYDGTGLGLSLSKYLVELHGGEIGVSSKSEIGSTFYFTLPGLSKNRRETAQLNSLDQIFQPVIKEALNIEAVKSKLPLSSEGSGVFEILIVDDDPVNLQVISGYLSSKQFNPNIFDSGVSVLKYLEKQKPDLVLLDIMMPLMSGFEVCRRIRERYSIDELPVIFLTAKNQVSDLLEGFSSGANDYITKPFMKNELLVRIDRHLEATRSINRLSSLNHFSEQLKKASGRRQIMEQLFLLICHQLEIDTGLIFHRKKIINQFQSNDDSWAVNYLNLDHSTEEIILLNTSKLNPILSLSIPGFEEYRLLFKRTRSGSQYSALDREYILSLVNRIKGSRYQFEELLKDPNLLISLFKIQSEMRSIMYIKTKSPYCYVYQKDQDQPTIHRISIKLLQRYFHEDVLLKIQRSYLVNLEKVTAVKKAGKDDRVIVLADGTTLPISRNLIPKLLERFPQIEK